MRRILWICFVLVLLPSWAGADMERYLKLNGGHDNPYDYEFQYLPEYCPCWSAKNRERFQRDQEKWKRIFLSKGERGMDYVHLHHYCFGLVALSRMERGQGNRKHLLGRAASEFGYVIKHSSRKFILLPEIHTKMGLVKLLQRKGAEAAAHFARAIKLNKTYVPAYQYLIGYYMTHGKTGKALQVGSLGLKYNPDSAYLKEMVAKLGG